MTQRHAGNYETVKNKGPVITISRDYGCYGSEIAEQMSKKLTAFTGNKWKWISREILEDAAKELKVRPDTISHIFGAKEKGFILDLMDSFSDVRNASDANIKRTITEIVKMYADEGNCIIVGRASCVIAKDIKKSLHVKIFAPIQWRMEQVKTRFNLSGVEAKNRLEYTDKKRAEFMDYFKGKRPNVELFDAMFNRATLSTGQIVGCIENLAKECKIIQPMQFKI